MLSRLILCGNLAPPGHASPTIRTFLTKASFPNLRTNTPQRYPSIGSSSNVRPGSCAKWTLHLGRRLLRALDKNSSALVKRCERLGPALIPTALLGYAFVRTNVVRPRCKVKDRRVGLDSSEKNQDPPFNWSLFLQFLKPQVRLGKFTDFITFCRSRGPTNGLILSVLLLDGRFIR